MKTLLLPAAHTRNCVKVGLPEFVSEERGAIPPLGVMYLASALEKEGLKVSILDTQFKDFDDYKKIEQEIRRIKPDVVGIQALTFSLPDTLLLAKIVKKIDPSIKTVFGGRHVDIYPEEAINFEEVDALVLGEGELVLSKLIKHEFGAEKLKNVKGLVIKEKGKKMTTGNPGLIEDLDSLRFPARHLTGYRKYGDLLSKKNAYTSMISSRGCPHNCLFCDNHQRFRKRTANNVLDEMEDCVKKGIEEIMIYDSTFTTDKKRVMDICHGIKERKLDFIWSTPTRVDCIDEELVKAMKKSGCERLQYGLESGTQKVLNNLRKGINIEQIRKAVEITRKYGITVFADFMLGSPGETREDILKTIDFAKKLKIDYATFQITMPYPDTDLYREGLKKGVLKNDYWREFAKNPSENFEPAYWEEYLTKEELKKLVELSFKKFYVRPSYIIRRVVRLRSLEEFKRQIKAGLRMIGI